MFFIPVGLMDALSGIIETASAQEATSALEVGMPNAIELVFAVPIIIAILYMMLWGQACTLMVAKRMVASPAGRTRTSFSAVRKQAKKYIAALFITEILRSIITVLLALLLIVPSVIYSIRTIFFDIMMIERGRVSYGRDALKASNNIVKGHTWSIFWRIFTIGLCIFLPVGILDSIITELITMADVRLETLALILTDFIDAFATVFFIVCAVALYADFKKALLPNC